VTDSTGIELLQPGETILNGQYTIEKHLGSGGRGQVYLASHRIFGQVAVKRLHPHIAAQEGLARFERELRITDQLRGDHVIFIRNFEKDPARDEWFSVMEYADAGSLEDKLAIEAPLPIVEAIELTITLCQALAPIHQYPYVHGDLKPSNILFHAGPIGKLTLKLSDFGSAFPPVQADELPLPSGLKEARTLMYVSPELLDASDPEDTEALTVGVDQRADIYAIGVILYEMLAGRPPFWGPLGESEDMIASMERQRALFQKIKQEVPPEPKSQRSETLPSLNELIMKALAKAPADRFASVDEMQVRLKEVLHEERARLAKLARLRPLADQALREKQWRQASDLLYKILNLDPGDRNALEKLEMTENQQQLMSLRLQKIPQAMNDELWEEARKLVEEALAIDSDNAELKAYQMKIANQLTIAETLAQAREAESKEDWRTAVNLCLEAIRLDPNHAEASRLLDHTRRQLRIATLRQEAETRRQQKDKQGELETLKELQKIIPTDDEVNARIEELQRTINLETYHAQGKKAYDEKRWKAAVEALENVVAIDKFYLDAASMLLEARDQVSRRVSILTNPYQPGRPISSPEMFFGREDVFDFLREHLVGKFQDNIVVLHGQRRTGKTSILYQIEVTERLGPDVLPILIDLQGILPKGLASFVYQFADEIASKVEIDLPDPTDFQENPLSRFQEFLPQVWQKLKKRRLLLMLDEYELLDTYVREGNLDEMFFSFLRTLIQHEPNLGFLFAGTRKFEELDLSRWELLGGALYKKISFLDQKATRRLITEPVKGVLEYQPEAVDTILQLTSGHPYYVQLICHELFSISTSQGTFTIKTADVESITEALVERATPQLATVWNGLTTGEKLILTATSTAITLAITRKRAVSEGEIRRVLARSKAQLGKDVIGTALQALTSKDFLIYDPATSQYHFAVDLLRLWIDRQHSLDELLELSEDQQIEVAYRQARQYFAEGRFDEAISQLVSVVRVDPDYKDAAVLRKACHLIEKEDWDKASDVLLELAVYDPKYKDAAYQLVRARERHQIETLEGRNIIQVIFSAWQQIVAAARTWKGVLALIGLYLTFIVLPVLTAENNTPLGMMRERLITYFSGAPAPTPRSIGETEFVVNGVTVVDIAQPHCVTDTRYISIEVRVRDADGETISDDEISCQWTFDPQLPEQAIRKEDGCQISYQVPENLDSQLVQLEAQGKDKIAGMSTNFIHIILQSDKGIANG
jgi:serine/threonine protein kinase